MGFGGGCGAAPAGLTHCGGYSVLPGFMRMIPNYLAVNSTIHSNVVSHTAQKELGIKDIR